MEKHEALNTSLKLLCKRGQAQSPKIESVLINKYPAMTKDMITDIVTQSIEIMDSAIQLATKEFKKEVTREKALNEIREQWPIITDEIVEEAYAHAWYLAVR